jgi:NADH:ubiquinone oxidoreductase subunit 5 (subunit L)/multisubunit Na+/H+ antiporter MnhA subunit
MFLLIFLTFSGKQRYDEHHVHVHESPWSMLGPLVILALLFLASLFAQHVAVTESVRIQTGFLAASARMAMVLLRQGRLIPVPEPDKALRFLESEGQAPDARVMAAP